MQKHPPITFTAVSQCHSRFCLQGCWSVSVGSHKNAKIKVSSRKIDVINLTFRRFNASTHSDIQNSSWWWVSMTQKSDFLSPWASMSSVMLPWSQKFRLSKCQCQKYGSPLNQPSVKAVPFELLLTAWSLFCVIQKNCTGSIVQQLPVHTVFSFCAFTRCYQPFIWQTIKPNDNNPSCYSYYSDVTSFVFSNSDFHGKWNISKVSEKIGETGLVFCFFWAWLSCLP